MRKSNAVKKLPRQDATAMQKAASVLATQITTIELLKVICDETSIADDGTGRARARALLAGHLGESMPASSSSLRNYVKYGLTLLRVMPDTARDAIDAIQHQDGEMDAGTARTTISWLMAFSAASESADVGDLAIALAEDWLDLNDSMAIVL